MADDEVVQEVAFRLQSEWKPEYEKVVRTTLAVIREEQRQQAWEESEREP